MNLKMSLMSGSRHSRNSVFLAFLVLLLATSDTRCDIGLDTDAENDHVTLTKAILIEPNYTGLDCYFHRNEECYWTWDADNFTLANSDNGRHKPGQNGYIILEGPDVKNYHEEWKDSFFGPYYGQRSDKYPGKS